MNLFLCSVLLLLGHHVKVDAVEKPLVYTGLGIVQGTEDRSTLGKKIYVFQGVPYAKPPVGELRFKEPQVVEKWPGIWSAEESSSVCLQHMLNYDLPDLITGEEDCLYLNIYTPTITNSSHLPVLVFFHGGAFMYGTGHIFTPHFILDRADFVYVSVNYRLGPFGFLSTGDEVVPGNNGLKDQVIALRWVQEHIAAFGGDKDNVIIAGLSAGGASVHLHYLSSWSTGLFKRGISLSGTAFCPWVLVEKASLKTKMLASAMGCPTTNSEEIVQCLKRRPGKKILDKLKSLFWPFGTLPFSPFGVVIESSGDKPFLSEHPYKLITDGKVANLPWLTSVTTEEGLYPAAAFVDREFLLKELNDNWQQIVPHILDYNYTVSPEQLNHVSKQIRQFYFGDEEITIKNRDKVVEMVGDRLFVVDMERAARSHAAVTRSPVYCYTFGYRGKHSISVFISKFNKTLGVSHGDDLIYLLNRPILSPLQTEEDKQMMIKMTNIWISFILTGEPSPGPGIRWDPVGTDDSRDFPHLVINSSKDIGQVFSTHLGNRQFWETIKFDELQNKIHTELAKDEL